MKLKAKPKRPRPRPNMIHVDMSDKIRAKLDQCVAEVRRRHNPFYGITEFIQIIIEQTHEGMFGENQNNSKN